MYTTPTCSLCSEPDSLKVKGGPRVHNIDVNEDEAVDEHHDELSYNLDDDLDGQRIKSSTILICIACRL